MSRRAVGAAILACAACGRIGFDAATTDGIDGVPADGVTLGDGATLTFGPPILVEPLGDLLGDDDPTVTGELLEMYFNTEREYAGNDTDIFVSKRNTSEAPWGPPSRVLEFTTSQSEGDPQVSPDGLTIWFASKRAGGQGGFDIWTSRRTLRSDPWGAPTNVIELDSNREETGAAPDPSL